MAHVNCTVLYSHLQSHDLIFTTVHKCNTVQYISVFVHVQQQSSDHGLLSASFLLTADEQRAGQPSTTSTSTNFPVSRKERERKRQRQERGQEQEGERRAGEHSRWMLSGLRGQHVLH